MKNLKLGFTLVELLIVIAIIGILAAALLVTLDPIEQINKSRDGAMIATAKEVVNACERYYAFNEECPSPLVCLTLETAGELKTNACTGITAISCGASGTCTANFTNKSKHYKAKCSDTTCTIPDEIAS